MYEGLGCGIMQDTAVGLHGRLNGPSGFAVIQPVWGITLAKMLPTDCTEKFFAY
jgi:hypothetical protein